MVYRADDGTPDPGYELDISQLETTRGVDLWLEHLETKRWIRPEDLADLANACAAIMEERLVKERNLPVPQAMSWEDYQKVLTQQWNRFLASANPTDEAAFQKFLEQNPALLPGPHGTPYGRYRGPLFDAVFTQPELPGFRAKRPDFLLFEQDSARIYAVLIEIEAPGKQWATKSGTPTSALVGAIDQLRDWKAWFSEPHNVLAFRDLYKVDPEQLDSRTLVQHYVLVYGRREEATRSQSFAKKRSSYAGQDEFLMTYDRLLPNGSAKLTVKLDRSGADTKLRLISMSPTFSLDRENAELFSSLLGREEAIRKQPLLSEERKEFLLKRLQMADQYVENMRKRQTDTLWLGPSP